MNMDIIGLDNLKELDLSNNELVNFDLDIFDNIGKFVELLLYESIKNFFSSYYLYRAEVFI